MTNPGLCKFEAQRKQEHCRGLLMHQRTNSSPTLSPTAQEIQLWKFIKKIKTNRNVLKVL